MIKSIKFNIYRIKYFLKELFKKNYTRKYSQTSDKYNKTFTKKILFSFQKIKNVLNEIHFLWIISYSFAKKEYSVNMNLKKITAYRKKSQSYGGMNNINKHFKKKAFNPLSFIKTLLFDRFAFSFIIILIFAASAAFLGYGFFSYPSSEFKISGININESVNINENENENENENINENVNIDEIIENMAKMENENNTIEGDENIIEEGMPLVAEEEKPYVTYITYEVKEGDNISFIAKRHGISIDAVFSANANIDSKNLRVGNKLRIPNKNGITYKIAQNDNLSTIAQMFETDVESIKKANRINGSKIIAGRDIFIENGKLTKDARLKITGIQFINPVRGRLTSKFGSRIHPVYKTKIHHNGIDIGGNGGSYIVAAQSGTVVFAGEKNGYGNYVVIKHKDKITTAYGHLAEILTHSGKKVSRGERIGIVGRTGVATGEHLHFEVISNGKFVNPRLYVSY